MLILDTELKSLEIILSGAVTTNQLPFVASWADINQSNFAMSAIAESDGLSNGATAVTMIAAPNPGYSRQLKFLSIFQNDTTAKTVTVRVNNNGTFRIVWKGTLQVGDNWLYTDDILTITDTNGNVKISFGFGDPVTPSHGGTGTSTVFTAGSVVFAGPSGVYAQDNANFFWDDTNNRLGIGTNSPNNKLEVVGGGLRVQGTVSGTASGAGIEIQYTSAPAGVILAFNRATAAYQPLNFSGSEIVIAAVAGLKIALTAPVAIGADFTPSFILHTKILDNSTSRWLQESTGSGQVSFQLKRTGGTAADWLVYIPSGSANWHFYDTNGIGDSIIFKTGGMLAFQGVSNAEVALKRSSTELQIRLADDSAFAPLRSSQLMAPLIIGGTAVGQTLTFQTSTGVTVAGADFIWVTGNNGSIEHLRLYRTNGVLATGGGPNAALGSGGQNYINAHCATNGCGINISTDLVADGTVVGYQDWGTRGTAGAEKRGVAMQCALTASAAASITADLIIYTTSAGSITEKLRITSGGNVQFQGRSIMSSPANAQFIWSNAAGTIGVGFQMNVDSVLLLANRAQNAFATLNCLGLQASGVAGFNGTVNPVTSITVVNGIVTAAS